MRIDKILNNNVVVSTDENKNEIIVMGRGLGFKQKTGNKIDEDKIEKIFTLEDKKMTNKFKALIEEIPMEYMLITEKIINYAKLKLGRKLSDIVYITLTDHIYYAIQRYHEGINIKNILLVEIKQLYKEELEIGKKALKMVNEHFNISLPPDEAGFIALHIVNADLDENVDRVMSMTKMMQKILKIVKYHFNIEYDEESLEYYRFVTHLKFFSQRILNGTFFKKSNEDSLFEIVKTKYKNSYNCTRKIKDFIKNEFNYNLSKEEMLYLTIHIRRVSSKINS